MEVNHAGVARSSRAMDDEGCFLLLRTKVPYEVQALDAALPPDEGDSPANGGWFRTKRGWVLLLEGFASERDPFVADLVDRMQAEGIEGTLTGASSAGEPAWCKEIPWEMQLAAVIGFRPQTGRPLFGGGWLGGPEQEPAVAPAGARWLAGAAQTAIYHGPHYFSSWSQPADAARLMVRRGSGVSEAFDEQRREVRTMKASTPGILELAARAVDYPWRDTVAALRAALLGLPLAEVSVAMVTHRDWVGLSQRGPKDGELYVGPVFRYHPELWAQFIPEPSGIQVLTNTHIDAAHDLSGWLTTRLDDNHVLVEARDLEPWYAVPAVGTPSRSATTLGSRTPAPGIPQSPMRFSPRHAATSATCCSPRNGRATSAWTSSPTSEPTPSPRCKPAHCNRRCSPGLNPPVSSSDLAM